MRGNYVPAKWSVETGGFLKNIYKGAPVQKLNQFTSFFLHSHLPTAWISGNWHPPLTFCICLHHFPRFQAQFSPRLALSSGSLQTELMFRTPETWRGLQSELMESWESREWRTFFRVAWIHVEVNSAAGLETTCYCVDRRDVLPNKRQIKMAFVHSIILTVPHSDLMIHM